MGVIIGIGIAVLGILAVLALRSLTTLFHEMGHAIPALLFSKDKVRVYIGSYGKLKGALPIRLGRLEIFFKLNFLDWNLGMCQHGSAKHLWQDLLIIIGGPIASLLIAIPMFIIMVSGQYGDLYIFFAAVLLMASVIDFIVNIFPGQSPLILFDGSESYNDGKQLSMLLSRAKLPPAYFLAEKLYSEKKYDEVIKAGLDLINQSKQPPREIFHLMFKTFLHQDKKDLARGIFEELKKHYPLSDKENRDLGILHQETGNYKSAIHYFNKYLYHQYTDSIILTKRAQCFMNLGDKKHAVKDLDAAIRLSDHPALALALKGKILLQEGMYNEAHQLLQHALKIDHTIADIHLFLGMYYEKKGNYGEAYKYYQQAQEMNVDFHGIDFKVESMRRVDFER